VITHPLFILLAISNFMLYFWADVPYVFVTDFAINRGIPDNQATFLISVVGIVNTIGQVSDLLSPVGHCSLLCNFCFDGCHHLYFHRQCSHPLRCFRDQTYHCGSLTSIWINVVIIITVMFQELWINRTKCPG
jgi:hypothetical protein